jgi:hypothetical protein
MRKSNNLLVTLVLISGIVLLFINIGLISISFDFIWPLFTLVYGLYLFIQFFKTKNKEVLTTATILTGVGVVFLINTTVNNLPLQEMLPLWPLIPLLWGLGNLLTYLVDRKDKSWLLSSPVLLCGGAYFLLSNEPWIQGYLKFWPLILIAGCIMVLLQNASKKRSES